MIWWGKWCEFLQDYEHAFRAVSRAGYKMSQSEIIPLRCPSCGSAETVGAREVRFGFHFTCRHCATPSVIIVGRELYIPKPGEHVCLSCGRVAPSGTRYCQCGQAMLRRCTNRWCINEIAIDHAICGECGWPQSLAWDTPEGKQLEITMAIDQMNKGCGDRAQRVQQLAPPEIGIPAIVAFAKKRRAEGSDSDAELAYTHMEAYGEVAYPAIISNIVAYPDTDNVRSLCNYGHFAVPTLIGLLEIEDWGGTSAAIDATRMLLSTLTGASRAVLILALIKLLQNEEYSHQVTQALYLIGPEVIPYLKPFTGFFKERRMKRKAKEIISNLQERI